MRGLGRKKQNVPECAVVAPRLQVPGSPPLPVLRAEVTWCRSASSRARWAVMAQRVLLCLPLQQTTVLAVCPFCKDREVWRTENEVFWSTVLCFTPWFPGAVKLCDGLDMFLLFIKDSSWQGPEESTSAEPKGVISAHETEISSLAFLKEYVGWDRYKVSFCLLLFSHWSLLPSVYWVLLSEFSGLVRHKPPSVVIRKGAVLSA